MMSSPSPRAPRMQHRGPPPEDSDDNDQVGQNLKEEVDSDSEVGSLPQNTSYRSNLSFGKTDKNNSSAVYDSPQYSDRNLSRLRDTSFRDSSFQSNSSPHSSASPRSHTSSADSSYSGASPVARQRQTTLSKQSCSPSLYPNLKKGDKSNPSPKVIKESNSIYPDVSNESLDQSKLSASILKEADKSSSKFCIIAVFVFILFGLITVLFVRRNAVDESLAGLLPFEKFVKNIESLEQDFPTQKRRTWRTVKATAKHVLNETEPIYPSIILMSGETGQSKLTTCIAEKVADKFKWSSGDRTSSHRTDVDWYKHLAPGLQKMRLDEAFQQAFHKRDGKSILVENLQSLSGEAALLLYKYCDNDNAPYPDVLIVLTLNLSTANVDLSKLSNVENFLADIWKRDINADKVNALMSRVANNVVVVHPESEEVLRQNC